MLATFRWRAITTKICCFVGFFFNFGNFLLRKSAYMRTLAQQDAWFDRVLKQLWCCLQIHPVLFFFLLCTQKHKSSMAASVSDTQILMFGQLLKLLSARSVAWIDNFEVRLIFEDFETKISMRIKALHQKHTAALVSRNYCFEGQYRQCVF